MDPRHEKRINIIQQLYSLSYLKNNSMKYDEKTLQILKKEKKINLLIEKYASKFPLEKIAKVDLAILKLAIYELTEEKLEPPKVIIDEAVELAKELGSEKSFSFINAVLGKVYNESTKIKTQNSNPKPKT